MAATIQIHEMSASMTGTDKTSGTVRFKLADNSTVDTSNPITVPSSGTQRSFQKVLRLYCDTAPDTQIDNLQMYTDGGTFAASVGGIASNIGETWSANATAAIVNEASLFTLVTGAPMDLDNTKSTACTATGYFGDMAKVQLVVEEGASSGELTDETLTFSYDEI